MGPNAMPALAVKSFAACACVACADVLARLKPKRASFTTCGLNTCVSLSTVLRMLNNCVCGLNTKLPALGTDWFESETRAIRLLALLSRWSIFTSP